MKKIRTVVACAASGLLLAACATPDAPSQGGQSVAAQALKEVGAGKLLVVQVPAASNPISNGMIVSMLAGGSSTGSVNNILMALRVPDGGVHVTGRSPSVNVATLKRALKDFQGRSNARVYIDASPAQINELRELATPKGIVINGGK